MGRIPAPAKRAIAAFISFLNHHEYSPAQVRETLNAVERETILAELRRNQFNVAAAARALDLERSHLYKKAEQLGIDLRSIRKEQDSQS